MFREKYKRIIDQVYPNDELIGEVLKLAHRRDQKKKIVISFFRKPVAAVIALCVCMVLALPALAGAVEPIYQLLYTVSPRMAQLFMPVKQSDEDLGIQMNVESAYIHDHAAEIYITMRDLTGDRIDGTTDLYDSYSINRPFDSSASCRRIGYDEKTKTATFLISMTEWGNQKITGDKITFSVKEFLSHKKYDQDIKISLDLSSVEAAKNPQTVYTAGGGGKGYTPGETAALTPSQAIDGFPVEGIALTGIGYIGGKLHIQTAVYDRLSNDAHGFFYLKKPDGDVINCESNFYFVNQSEQPGRIDYCEYVFDTPREGLGAYALYGNFVTSGMHTKGNWRVTFPLEQAK